MNKQIELFGLRKFINEVLSEHVGDQYSKSFPQGIQDRLKERLAQRTKRHPYEEHTSLSGYELLSFCDVMDYSQIIQKNWQYFGGYFSDALGEVERHFLNLKEYRNSLMHNRPMNTIERKQGEASAEWVSKIIQQASEDSEEEGDIEETDDSIDLDITGKEIHVQKDGIDVRGVLLSGEKMNVLKGSFGIAQNTPSFTVDKTYRCLKDRLIEKGIIVLEGNKSLFNDDYMFESTSAAASVILSRSASGPNFWKLK